MKYLITGASGFLGSHLVKRLQGESIFSVYRDSLYDPEALKADVQSYQPDYIIMAHAYGNMGHQKDPEQIYAANVTATWNMLSTLQSVPYKGLIHIGSSSEYGQKLSTMKESDIPEGDTFYAATKIAGTYLTKAFSKQYDKPNVTVRPFSVYGPGEADFRLIPTAIKHMIQGTKMPFVSWPEHDWINISDFIDGLLLVLENAEQLKGQVVNIGTGQATRNDEILTILSYLSEKGVKTEETYQEQPHHSPVWVADNSLLRSLGWKQQVTLPEGLKRCWEYYKEKYEKV